MGSLAQVLRSFGMPYLASHALNASQAKAWRAIAACRTPALGGHTEQCLSCGTHRHVHHSCRNRHCPTCQTRAKEAWLAARRQELLSTPYFHLVFTLPHVLNRLVAYRARALYEMLFSAVASTLTEFAANPRHLGGEGAFSLVLHTWKQDLERHVHVHALVAGGALKPEGDWVYPRKGFLFPVKALSAVFRGKFMSALQGCVTDGVFPWLQNPEQWREVKRALYAHDWVVYAKEPLGGPAQVLEYLGRYTHRVAISNERIVGIDQHVVRLRVRADPNSASKRTLSIEGREFIRRFLLHVLPSGFKRIRHYGLLAPSRKARCLPLARTALSMPKPDPCVLETVATFLHRVAQVDSTLCPHCRQSSMVFSALLPKKTLSPANTRGPP